MAAPTQEELELLKTFRENIKDVWDELTELRKTDQWLLTWLRARDLNLNQAEEMFRKSLGWRKERNFDNAINWVPPEYLPAELPCEIHGFTEDKSPVLWVWFGKWDVKRLTESPGGDELFTCYNELLFSKVLQQLTKHTQIPDRILTQFVCILDFEGYSYRQLTSTKAIKACLELISNFENNCPEMLKKAVVINAPKIFSILFAIVKPLLTARTLAKVEIFGSNSAEWMQVLRENIPVDQLPSNYGGTAPKAQPLPRKARDLINSDISDEDGPVETLIVAAGKKCTIDCEVREMNSVLSWIFQTKKHDIGFQVLFEDNSEVYKYERLSSDYDSSRGMLLCERKGKYTLVFDNTFSRLRSKTITYSMKTVAANTNGEKANGNS